MRHGDVLEPKPITTEAGFRKRGEDGLRAAADLRKQLGAPARTLVDAIDAFARACEAEAADGTEHGTGEAVFAVLDANQELAVAAMRFVIGTTGAMAAMTAREDSDGKVN